ncbi:hypothetical protein EPH_0016960 [Eimeria praecox]|uniref:Uncharacterized protein n=1 Tax=Eimeria praecox TaxID=51316 RepID=U6H2S3_9EIME|nr:hypothetical protein EPH_0016960 [Eimeria praecox]
MMCIQHLKARDGRQEIAFDIANRVFTVHAPCRYIFSTEWTACTQAAFRPSTGLEDSLLCLSSTHRESLVVHLHGLAVQMKTAASTYSCNLSASRKYCVNQAVAIGFGCINKWNTRALRPGVVYPLAQRGSAEASDIKWSWLGKSKSSCYSLTALCDECELSQLRQDNELACGACCGAALATSVCTKQVCRHCAGIVDPSCIATAYGPQMALCIATKAFAGARLLNKPCITAPRAFPQLRRECMPKLPFPSQWQISVSPLSDLLKERLMLDASGGGVSYQNTLWQFYEPRIP